MPVEDVKSFENLKGALLHEHRLTPLAYRQNFYQATRRGDESYIQYSTRLHSLLKYYLNSRVIEDDYRCLVELLVSDRIKDALPTGMRYHISDKEGVEWFTSAHIAELADLYDSDRGRDHDRSRQDQRKPGGGW